MPKKDVTVFINQDLIFLIHFQKNLINSCCLSGINSDAISAMQDILHILEAAEKIGILTELSTPKVNNKLKT